MRHLFTRCVGSGCQGRSAAIQPSDGPVVELFHQLMCSSVCMRCSNAFNNKPFLSYCRVSLHLALEAHLVLSVYTSTALVQQPNDLT